MKKAATREAFAKDKARNVGVRTCLEIDNVERITSIPVIIARMIKTNTYVRRFDLVACDDV